MSWTATAPTAPPDPLPDPNAIAVMLWPLTGAVGAAFYRGGWIRRCGSGALAAAAALHHCRGASAGRLQTATEALAWQVRGGGRYCISAAPLPLDPAAPPAEVALQVAEARSWYQAGDATDYWLAVLPHRQALARLRLHGATWSATTARALIAVAPGSGASRYYLRYFAPQYATDEDALTGSAHRLAARLWPAARACGRQLSAAGGVAWVSNAGGAARLTARCRLESPPEANLQRPS